MGIFLQASLRSWVYYSVGGGSLQCGVEKFTRFSFYAPDCARRARGGWGVGDVLSCRSTRKYQRNERGLRPSTPHPSARFRSATLRTRLRVFRYLNSSILGAISRAQDGCGARVRVSTLFYGHPTRCKGFCLVRACFNDGRVLLSTYGTAKDLCFLFDRTSF